MYPERFMSATRILETGSLPDELLSLYVVTHREKLRITGDTLRAYTTKRYRKRNVALPITMVG